ncbi:MAG TPA: hypothetical protein PLP19_10125 [bacterium]|nr:hypothetical protein [bacterium]HPN43835.1 hypothetical protein [bacterium]
MRFYSLLIFLFLLAVRLPAQDTTGTVVILDQKVGPVVDWQERRNYGLFKTIKDFKSATLYQQTNGEYVFKILTRKRNEPSSAMQWLTVTPKEIEKIRYCIATGNCSGNNGIAMRYYVDVGVSQTSYSYNDYISSRLSNTSNKYSINPGGFVEIRFIDNASFVAGVRYVKTSSSSDYYFVEPVVFRGQITVDRDYLSFPVGYKIHVGDVIKPFVYLGVEFKLLVHEQIENQPSVDYHRQWEDDNNPLFCDDCGYKRMISKMCLAGGFGMEFNIWGRNFYVQWTSTLGGKGTRCYHYSINENRLSLGYVF